MKLSEAIINGLKGRRRIRGAFWSKNFTECCILGAAYLATHKVKPGDVPDVFYRLQRKYPILLREVGVELLEYHITQMNDSGVPTSKILDLVRKMEAAK